MLFQGEKIEGFFKNTFKTFPFRAGFTLFLLYLVEFLIIYHIRGQKLRGVIFIFCFVFPYIEIPGSRGDSPLVFSRVLAIKKKEKKIAINREFVKNSRKLSNLKKNSPKLSKTLQYSPI